MSGWLRDTDRYAAQHMFPPAPELTVPFGGRFLLDPNEINGWGLTGPYDDTNSQDLGNVGAANLNRLVGGFTFPYDVNLLSLNAGHRNSNNSAQAWGWVVVWQTKTYGSNTVATTYILDEVADNGGTGPRDYGNNQNQSTTLDFSGVAAAQLIPAGSVVCVAVASPTAVATNYYVDVMTGYLRFDRP